MITFSATISLAHVEGSYPTLGPDVKPMSSPLETPEFGNLYLGNTQDDDAQVIQSYFTPAPDGPPNVHTEPIPPQPVQIPPTVLNRLICGYLTIVNTWDQPTPILPSDEFRTKLMIKAISTVATDGISFADNTNALVSPDGTLVPKLAARIFPSDGWVDIGPYTGALCASAAGASAPINFTWVSVTK